MFEALLPCLFALFFASGIFVGIRRAWRNRHQRDEKGPTKGLNVFQEVASVAPVLLFVSVMCAAVYSRFQLHYELWRLRPQDVQQIEIGTHRFTDKGSIEMVVRDLRSGEWYSVNHGGWGDETSIVLTTRSGMQWYMQAGYHFAQRGAVIRRSSGRQGTGWNYGQVFSAALPGTLEKLGVPLSHCDTVHGHPCPAHQAAIAKAE